jgi:segregation and condensation protein B
VSTNDINQFEFEEISRKTLMFSVIESLLFVSGEPLSAKDISKIIECNLEYTEELLNAMMVRYSDNLRGIKLIKVNDMYQLVSKPENSEYIQKLLGKNSRQSLSQASLESLAIIAYKQPITRIDIDEIRGVKSDKAIQRLLERNLVKEVGRLEVPGRPIQFGTTDEFLRQFGLGDLKEMPSIELFSEGEEKEESQNEE